MIIVANENRPDLAAGLDKNTIAGAATLVGPQIFPPMIVGEKTSTIQVAKVNRGGGVKNRTKGQNLAGVRVESVPMTYTVNSYEGRDILSDGDVRDCGGLDNALAAGARGAAWDAFKLYETDCHDAVSGAFADSGNTYSAHEIASAAPFDALAQAAQEVKDYGKPYLVCSETFIREFVKFPKVQEVLTDLFAHNWFKDIREVGVVNQALGLAFGTDAVIIGDDNFWVDTDAAYVVAVREEAKTDPRNVLKRLPSLGATIQTLPEENSTPEQPFQVSTVYLAEQKDSAVDVDYFAVPKVANVKAVAKVTLPA